MEKIVEIDIEKIYPHPRNPRKTLGDITELTNSIAMNGILQNLTVVPKPDGKTGEFLSIIGFRRCAAAKKAKLQTVPCVVSNMDEKQQVSTMMQENLQRSDLTILEQAEGFQMMLDLGDTVKSISETTGFSEATVRSRIKLMEYDYDKLQKSVNRGATLQDFAELAEVKDTKLKNKVLDTIGTSNFQYELRRAKEHEESQRKKAEARDILDTFATRIKDTEKDKLQQVKWISLYGKVEIEIPADADSRKYYYTDGNYIVLYAERTEEEQMENDIRTAAEVARIERQEGLSQIANRLYDMRYDFVKNLTGLKQQTAVLTELLAGSFLLNRYTYFDVGTFCDILDLPYDEETKKIKLESVSMMIDASVERVLLAVAYSNFGDATNKRYHDYTGEYCENETLDKLYEMLVKLGYELSDEERAYVEGTLPLFKNSGVPEGVVLVEQDVPAEEAMSQVEAGVAVAIDLAEDVVQSEKVDHPETAA